MSLKTQLSDAYNNVYRMSSTLYHLIIAYLCDNEDLELNYIVY